MNSDRNGVGEMDLEIKKSKLNVGETEMADLGSLSLILNKRSGQNVQHRNFELAHWVARHVKEVKVLDSLCYESRNMIKGFGLSMDEQVENFERSKIVCENESFTNKLILINGNFR